MRYQFQEHNQLHSLTSLEQINAQDAAYALTTASLSALLYALQTNNTATLLPHYALNMLPEQQTEEFAWLGKPIQLELKICWDRHHRAPELQQWFRQQLTTLLHQHLPLEKVS